MCYLVHYCIYSIMLLFSSPILATDKQAKHPSELTHPCDSVACNNAFTQNVNEPKPKKELALPSKEIVHAERELIITTKNHTCAIIKPDAVRAHDEGKIIDYILLNDFTIVGMIQKTLSTKEAEEFYAAHKDKPFFKALIEFMTSGPLIILELEHTNTNIDTINAWRSLMGTTNPSYARLGSIRYMFGSDIQKNAVHGSDSAFAARDELAFFFGEQK